MIHVCISVLETWLETVVVSFSWRCSLITSFCFDSLRGQHPQQDVAVWQLGWRLGDGGVGVRLFGVS